MPVASLRDLHALIDRGTQPTTPKPVKTRRRWNDRLSIERRAARVRTPDPVPPSEQPDRATIAGKVHVTGSIAAMESEQDVSRVVERKRPATFKRRKPAALVMTIERHEDSGERAEPRSDGEAIDTAPAVTSDASEIASLAGSNASQSENSDTKVPRLAFNPQAHLSAEELAHFAQMILDSTPPRPRRPRSKRS